MLAEIGNGFAWGLFLGLIGGLVSGVFEGLRIFGAATGRAGATEAVAYALIVNALGFGALLAALGALFPILLQVSGFRLSRARLAAVYVSGAFAITFLLGRLLFIFPARGLALAAGTSADVLFSLVGAIAAGLVLFPIVRLFAGRLLGATRRIAVAGVVLGVCLGLVLPVQIFLETRSYLGMSRGNAAAVDLSVLEETAGADLGRSLAEAVSQVGTGTSGPPNIILVTVDALRADHLGVCGNETVQTPNMDLLAAYGALSCNTYTAQPQSNPAFASLMTSLSPMGHGVRAHMLDRLADSFETLPEALASRGYTTAAILPWTALEPAFSGFHQGFDVYEAFVVNAPATLQNPITTAVGALYRRITDQVSLGGAVEATLGLREQVEEEIDGRADITAAAAVSWLASNRRSPFFLWVHFFDPHYPWTAPSPWGDMYEDGTYEGPYDGSMQFVWEMREGAFDPDERDVEFLRHMYASEVTYADDYLGQVLAYAGEKGLLRNTIVLLTGDHGESLGERPGPWSEGDSWLHGDDLYNPGIQVPLIVFDPRHARPGQRLAAPLELIDVMPTLLELAGARIPTGVEGRSILPLLAGTDDGSRRAAFTTLGDDRKSSIVAADGWKLITDWRTGNRELYFLPNDPEERVNLIRSAPTKAAALGAQLREWAAAGGINTAAAGEGLETAARDGFE